MNLKAHFKDQNHDTDLVIINSGTYDNGATFSFELDGIRFVSECGTLRDFQLADPVCFEEAKNKFHILRWGGNEKSDGALNYTYVLQRFEMRVEFPIVLFDKHAEKNVDGILYFAYELLEGGPGAAKVMDGSEVVYIDGCKVLAFGVNVGDKNYECDYKTEYFETSMNELSGKMQDDYHMLCCFTCQYSDYSPFGNMEFGDMQCYKDHKDEYLSIKTKDGFIERLGNLAGIRKQEISYCDEFRLRNICDGYRGFVDGIEEL